MMPPASMRQSAPYPGELARLVKRLRYRPGWTFALADIVRDPASSHGAEAAGLTFIVTTLGYDTYNVDRGERYRVNHYFPVPAATFNRASWRRWLFDCLTRVELHECMEFFAQESCACGAQSGHDSRDSACFPVVERPFAPLHGPGDDPYGVHEYATDLQRRTRFTGEVVE